MESITKVTIVPDGKPIKDYQRGDINPMDNHWFLCCPECGTLSTINFDMITKHEDNTVSSRQPLHCHGARSKQRFVIEKNAVRWL